MLTIISIEFFKALMFKIDKFSIFPYNIFILNTNTYITVTTVSLLLLFNGFQPDY